MMPGARGPNRRGLAAGLLLACVGLLLLQGPGCTRRASSSEDHDPLLASKPRCGGALHIMLQAPGTLDPAFVDDVYETCINNQLYDGLLEFDPNLNPVPAIAREWQVSRDGRTYTFQLRDDVCFHNGRRVVAEDFVYTFTRIFEPSREDHGIGGGYLCKIAGVDAFARGEADSIRGLEALDERTLRITLEVPYASFLSALAMDQTKVIPREEVERRGEEFWRHPIGTGPFVFQEADLAPGDSLIRLEANLDYFRGRPYLDEIIFHTPPDYTVDEAVAAMLAGKLSLADVRGQRTTEFDQDPRFRILRRPELSVSFVGLNIELEPLQDIRVRRAIAHAVNRERIVAVNPDTETPALGVLPPGMFGYSPQEKILAYDPELSRRLLAEAGYPNGEGLPPIEHWRAERGETGRRQDEILHEDMAAVGIRMVSHYVEWPVFQQALTEYRMPVFGLSWVADVPDPDSFLASLFATTGVYNLFRYSNPTVDSLLAAGGEMRSSVDRSSVYRRAEKIILEDVPMIPLYYLVNNYAVRAEVRGLVITPLGMGSLQLERVWLDAPTS
jgi:oligopeptide transport system substrate-binding protein